VQHGAGSLRAMALSVFVKATLAVFAFAALLAAFEGDGFVLALVQYFSLLMLVIVLEAYVAPRIRRRLRVRASRAHGSYGGYSGDGTIGGRSDCGWSDSGGDSGGGDGGGGNSC
jgi:uncharacterized membrane protein YgcG